MADPADLALQLAEMSDRAMRMEIALRLIHTYAMTGLLLPGSGAVRDWLRDWISGIEGEGWKHGPVGGPMLWPAHMPGVCAQLRMWGLEKMEIGSVGYVVLQREPTAGRALQ